MRNDDQSHIVLSITNRMDQFEQWFAECFPALTRVIMVHYNDIQSIVESSTTYGIYNSMMNIKPLITPSLCSRVIKDSIE